MGHLRVHDLTCIMFVSKKFYFAALPNICKSPSFRYVNNFEKFTEIVKQSDALSFPYDKYVRSLDFLYVFYLASDTLLSELLPFCSNLEYFRVYDPRSINDSTIKLLSKYNQSHNL